MSVLSVAQIKRGYTAGSKTVTHAPREGSKLRQFYDLLMTGQSVKARGVISSKQKASYVSQLTNFYGLEIERDGYGSLKLKGRWDGPYFVPIERFNEL